MDVYSATEDYLTGLPVLQGWAEACALLKQAARLRPRDWRLPFLACDAVGGTAEQALPAAAALACTQIGILLIDDMLDEDPRGEYRQIGQAQAANFASAFLAASSQAILHSQAQPTTKLSAVQSLSWMIVTIALGQSLDVRNPPDEAAYWRVVQTKSAPFFGAAFHLGALYGGATDVVAEKLEGIGRLYGGMVQIHDDLNDTLAAPANPDWTLGRTPLPILFAQTVDHPERARFLELRQNVSDQEALREAQNILIRCGAASYCVDQLLRRHHMAREALDAIPLIHQDVIEGLLEEMVAPVWRLLGTNK
ncbi:MAG: polyprenyl synthetase family protein [Anaerolineales bacterium]|nr:polyprenyl synthetase family protein [Anaerolineales bacterium]